MKQMKQRESLVQWRSENSFDQFLNKSRNQDFKPFKGIFNTTINICIFYMQVFLFRDM